MAAEGIKLHIVMFPWLAFGHMIPFLELAKLIAHKGHKISFISTPKNIDRLPKQLPPNLSSLITFVKLPLPHVQNLPENAEATTDVPFDKVKYLKIAYDGLQQSITEFIQNSTPDLIIFDFVAYWLGPLASKLNISSAYFSIFPAAALGFTGSAESMMGGDYRKTPEDFTVLPKWVTFESTVRFKLFELLRNNAGWDNESVSDLYRMGATIKGCDFVAIRSCYEFEPEWLRLLEDLNEKRFIPVGQLPPTLFESGDDVKDVAWREMKGWLDMQVKGRVVYVAFGSEAKLSQTELTEIALGLELSELPFFWVLRKQRGKEDTEVIELPEGFEERTKGRGVVCTSWAPQLKILSHDSVGGFLSHAGWGSVVEAIQFEKALVLLTFLADQGLNARFLEEKRMAYSIPRDDGDGSFRRDSVADSLKLVIIEKEGQIYRDKVKEMKNVFVDKNRQEEYIDNLLGYLEANRKIKRELI
uniref:UGT38 n=1 Tax=Panax notoginseng TaxID=44586 RepID=A0A977R8W8_9APIA|nr:UGT38 [Panax notoginseng]